MAEVSDRGVAAPPRVSTKDLGVGMQALKRLRESTAELVDVTPAAAPEDFRTTSTDTILTTGLLIDTRFSASRFDRTPAHIARGGMDHYMLSMYVDGEAEFATGRRVATVRAGDVILIDMARANRTDMAAGRSGAVHTVSLVLPRVLLAPLLGAPDSASASLLSRESPSGRLIGEHLFSLRREGARLSAGDAAAAVDGVAGLVAEAVGPAREAGLAVAHASRRALLAAIKSYIEKTLLSEAVAVPALCRRFRVSRATLYRLFESDGGLAHYVQDRRLHRAFMQLISPAGRQARLIDFALDYHFSSDNTFIRAFRHRFALTPGEVRELAAGRARTEGAGFGFEPEAIAWIDRVIGNQ
jgi:AraC-like DNA-binding protein